MQVTKYVEREILNHRFLMHPHIVQFKEVSRCTFHGTATFLQYSTGGLGDIIMEPHLHALWHVTVIF